MLYTLRMALVSLCEQLLDELDEVGHEPRVPVPYHYVDIVELCYKIATDYSSLEDCGEGATMASLSDLRLRLWHEFTVCDINFLCDRHYDPESDYKDYFCFGSLIFRAITNLSAMMAKAGCHHTELVAVDMPFCRDNSLCLQTRTPIANYTPAQLADALLLLRNQIVSCVLDTALVQYVELLEMTISMWLHNIRRVDDVSEEQQDAALGEHPQHRNTIDNSLLVNYVAIQDEDQTEPVLYHQVTDRFVDLAWASLLGIHRRIMSAQCFGHYCEEPLASKPEAHSRAWLCAVRDYLLQVCVRNTYVESSQTMKEDYVLLHARPGDRELYMLVKPGSSMSVQGIVSESLGDARVLAINKDITMSPIVGVKTHLQSLKRDFSDYSAEPLWFGLCLYDMLSMHTTGDAGASWSQYYARRDPQIRASSEEALFCADNRPILCQLFGHWQLVYRGRVHWYNSALMAYVAWCRLKALQDRIWFTDCDLFSCPAPHPSLPQDQYDLEQEKLWAAPFIDF